MVVALVAPGPGVPASCSIPGCCGHSPTASCSVGFRYQGLSPTGIKVLIELKYGAVWSNLENSIVQLSSDSVDQVPGLFVGVHLVSLARLGSLHEVVVLLKVSFPLFVTAALSDTFVGVLGIPCGDLG